MSLFRAALAFALIVSSPAFAAAEAAPACKGRDLLLDPNVRPNYAAFADELVNGDGLLWRIDKDGVRPSYLYGTIHSTQPGPLALAREAAQHLADARDVVTELGGPFDTAAKVNMSAGILSAALSADSDTFAGRFSPTDAALVENYLAARGYPIEMAHHLKLWFLDVATSLPSCEQEGERQNLPEVDETLAELAKAKGLAVIGLETFEDQLDALAATPPTLAAEMLAATARAPDLEDDAYVTLLSLYELKQPARAIAVIDALPGVSDAERAAERDFTRLLLIGRNATMAARAAPELAAGGAFVAVGALHLSGTSGLVERFRAMGYRVTKVW